MTREAVARINRPALREYGGIGPEPWWRRLSRILWGNRGMGMCPVARRLMCGVAMHAAGRRFYGQLVSRSLGMRDRRRWRPRPTDIGLACRTSGPWQHHRHQSDCHHYPSCAPMRHYPQHLCLLYACSPSNDPMQLPKNRQSNRSNCSAVRDTLRGIAKSATIFPYLRRRPHDTIIACLSQRSSELTHFRRICFSLLD
jgi:hypothetical protein